MFSRRSIWHVPGSRSLSRVCAPFTQPSMFLLINDLTLEHYRIQTTLHSEFQANATISTHYISINVSEIKYTILSILGIIRTYYTIVLSSIIRFRSWRWASKDAEIRFALIYAVPIRIEIISRTEYRISVQLCLALLRVSPWGVSIYHVARGSPWLSGGLPEDYQRILLLPDNTV